MMVEWMVAHPFQARGTMTNCQQGKQQAQRLWEEVASRLNSVGDGTTKTAKEWRQMGIDEPKLTRSGSISPPPLPLAYASLTSPPGTSSTHGIGELPQEERLPEVESELSDVQPSPCPPCRPLKRKRVAAAGAHADGSGDRSRPQV